MVMSSARCVMTLHPKLLNTIGKEHTLEAVEAENDEIIGQI